jgi:TATA-box binding protein (TBP) (component of TFIID and TFIIIB)
MELDTPVALPQPTELRLIIVTSKTHLDCNMNLELIAKKLVLDDKVIGKKLLGVIEEGLIKKKVKSPKKPKNGKKRSRKDFSNQCTVIVRAPKSDKKLNLKIFGNGKIVITGGLSEEDGKYAVNILRERIRDVEDTYQIKQDFKFSDCFDSTAAYLKFIFKNYLIFLKFFSMYQVNIDLRLDIVLNKKLVEKLSEYDSEICDPVKDDMLRCDDPSNLDKYLRLIQIFNICHLYFPNDIFLDKLNKEDTHLVALIHELYSLKPVILPLTFSKDKFDNDFVVTVENYNTMFHCGFQNNREVFTQILNNKYKLNGLIESAKFEPSNYQGINVKYISRILCNPKCESLGKKKNNKCGCKEISFLIFQEGNIIITGGKSWRQLLDGYNVILNIIKDEYNDIVVEKPTKSSDTDMPAQIVKNGGKVVYINKQRQILENPRNMFLLKKLAMLNLY